MGEIELEDIKSVCEYLTTAKELEVNLYTQQLMLSKLKKRIDSLNLNEKKIVNTYKINEFNMVKAVSSSYIKYFFMGAIIAAIIYVLWIIMVLVSPNVTTMEIVRRNIFLATLFALGISLIFGTKKFMKFTSEHNKEVARYNDKMRQVKQAQEKEKIRVEEAKREREFLIVQYNEILRVKKNTEATLKEFYKDSFVFPKYLNMIAVIQILEYFQSGRCTELTGPDGAYNLYESELRMNRIVDKLQVIIEQLEEIKSIQYSIYQEICRVNDTLNGILDSIDYACNSMDKVAVNSAVAAYNSSITAYNTSIMSCVG